MHATINGKDEVFTELTSLSQMLAARGIDSRLVVVEVNLDIVNRDSYGSTFVGDGDAIEILRFVGGG